MIRTRSLFLLFLVVVALIALALTPSTAIGDADPLLSKSRDVTARFASELQTAVQDAMATGGPVVAIGVCKDVAPQIASKLSRDTGAKVSRTSLKYRNPGNAPEAWQTAVLRDFDAQAITESPAEVFDRTGKYGAHYMKAIPMGPLCLTCHGSELPADVQERLSQDYPHDQARGYSLGDVRGAFSVTWPDAPTE
jgi:hypothetical protein